MLPTDPNVRDALDAYLKYRETLASLGTGSPGTVAVLRRRARPLIEKLGEIETKWMRTSKALLYIAERTGPDGKSPATVNQEMSLLQSALRWVESEGYIIATSNMPRAPMATKTDSIPPMAMAMDVLARLPDHHKMAMGFMAMTGVSPHELERICPCDFVGGELHIGKRVGFPVKARARIRTIPLSCHAKDIAKEVCAGRAPDEPVFPRREAMAKALAKVQPRVGDKITPKTMRSLFASTIAGEHPEHVLQALLGHAPGSPVTRRHYTRSDPTKARAAIAGVSRAMSRALRAASR